MIPKRTVILQASKKLLLVDLSCWNVVEEILSEVYEAGRAEKIVYRNFRQMRPIMQCSRNDKPIESFSSLAEAVDILGISKGAIINNLKGRTKLCKNKFIFKYIDDEKTKEREVSM